MTAERNAGRRGVAPIAALACFFATLPVYSPNIMALASAESSAATGAFSRTLLVVVSACCVAFTASAYARRRMRADDPRADAIPLPLLRMACALYALGCAGHIAAVSFFPSGALAALTQPLFALCAGAGFVPVAVGWAEAFRTRDLRDALAAVAAAALMTSVCGICLAQLPVPACGAVHLALLAVGSAGPALIRRGDARTDETTSRNDAASPSNAAARPASTSEAPHATLRAFASVMGPALLGMALSSLVMGIAPTSLFGDVVGAPETGMVLAAAVLLVLAAKRGHGPFYSFAYQVFLPAAAALALVLCVACQAGPCLDAALLGAHALYAATTLLAIATACAVSNAREFSRPFVLCALIGAFTLCALAGLTVGGLLGTSSQEPETVAQGHAAATIVLTVCYALFLLFGGCVKAWRLSVLPNTGTDDAGIEPDRDPSTATETPAGPTREALVDRRVDEVADEHGLTAREREILGYLGRGYGSSYIAKTLLISENTVRTHVRNIHRKLGVSGRDQLLQLVNTGEVYAES